MRVLPAWLRSTPDSDRCTAAGAILRWCCGETRLMRRHSNPRAVKRASDRHGVTLGDGKGEALAENDVDGLSFWKSPTARLVLGFVAGVAVAVALWHRNGLLALLGGWSALALVFTCWTSILLWSFTPEETKRHAHDEQPRRLWVVAGLILVGAVASLAGVLVLAPRRSSMGRASYRSASCSPAFTIHTALCADLRQSTSMTPATLGRNQTSTARRAMSTGPASRISSTSHSRWV